MGFITHPQMAGLQHGGYGTQCCLDTEPPSSPAVAGQCQTCTAVERPGCLSGDQRLHNKWDILLTNKGPSRLFWKINKYEQSSINMVISLVSNQQILVGGQYA